MRAIQSHLLLLGFELPQTDRDVVGGYFTWLALPASIKADALARRCKDEANVIIAAGRNFEVPGDESVTFEGHVRLCWSWEDEGMLEEGIRRVGEVAARMMEEGEGEGANGEYVVVEREGDGVGEFK